MALNFGSNLFQKETFANYRNKIQTTSINSSQWIPSGTADFSDVHISRGKAEALVNGITFVCPLVLPNGAEIISIIVYGNAAAAAETWILSRDNIDAEITTSPLSANINSSATGAVTIDNSLYRYCLQTTTLDIGDRIYGTIILYILSKKIN